MGRLADLHRPRCRVCGWTCSDGGCQPDLCSDVTRPAFPRRTGDTAARERAALASSAARDSHSEAFSMDEVIALHRAGAIDLMATLVQQSDDALARKNPGTNVWRSRHRCPTCGRLPGADHTEDCDAMPF